MKISKRLKTICDLVDKKTNVIDVGCDHALIDIYLTKYNENKCIAADISENAIKGALINIEKYNLTNEIDVRITDGLNGITIPDNNTIILSGMGTKTILKILEDTNNINNLIISSHNDLYLLRKNIIKKGFYIDTEAIIEDKKIFYTIIKFKKGKRKYNHYNYTYGINLSNKEYINYCINKNNIVLTKLPKKYVLKRIKLIKENNYLKKHL